MKKTIAVLKGDGIGPEIMDQAIKVLNTIADIYNHSFDYEYYPIGGEGIDICGDCLPDMTIRGCMESDAVLLGAVGGPKWDHIPLKYRPESGLLKLRKTMGVYANIRPLVIYESLKEASPLKNHIIEKGVDLCIVRELTGGIYFGDKYQSKDMKFASDTMAYSEEEIERIAHVAFDLAKQRHGKVTSIDKANVLSVSRLWRKTVDKVAKSYPEVALNHMYVDNGAMQMIVNPSQFDVVLTSNMFGDIISDEMSVIGGTIGLLPSSSVGDGKSGLYEPIHGSAPNIAGKGEANPLGMILSVSMMLRHGFNMKEESLCIENAVTNYLKLGYRTKDLVHIKERDCDKETVLSTEATGDYICQFIRNVDGK